MQRESGADFDRFVLDRSTALLRTAVLLVGDVGHAEDILQTWLPPTPENLAQLKTAISDGFTEVK